MTIITTQARVTYAGDNVSTLFPVPFEFFLNSDLTVVKNAIGGAVVTLVLNLDYTLTNAGVPGGGTLTKTTALLTGETMAIFLNPPIEQESHYISNSPFPASTLENDIDRQTQISQRLQDQISRALRAPDGDPASGTSGFLLPSSIARAGTNLGFDLNGNPSLNMQLLSGTLSAASIGAFIGPQTASEAATGVTIVAPWLPTGNMLRYGIIPNSAAARAANTAIAKALFSPTVTNGPQGQFYFPNTTGTDTYYFGNVILIRPDVYIDLNGCTIDYTSTCLSTETNSGLFFFLSDGGLQNGTINVACVTSATTGCGHAIFVGARGSDSPLITVYDSTYSPSLGRLIFSNLNINVNNTGTNVASSGAIEMLGGIRNIVFENITINLNSTTPYGIIYEFGWATNPGGTGTSQTSHMHNAQFRNIRVINVGNQDGGNGSGMWLGGSYNTIIDGLYVYSAPNVFFFTSGESLFYRPWLTVDDLGAKRNVTMRNFVGEAITGTGLALSGATPATGGYLAATIAALGHPADYIAQTDLMTFSLDGFVIQAAGVGINVSGPCNIRNGTLNGAAASGQLVIDDECTLGVFANVKILNGAGTGVRTTLAGAIWSPARLKQLIFDNCVVAGNTTNGYLFTNTRSVHIRGGRIGYSTLYDGVAETTQVNCVNVAGASGGNGVMIDSAYCTPGTAGTVYVGSGATAGNDVRNPKGTISFSGTWMINGLVNCSSTVLGDKTSIVNTADKYAGKLAYDTSNHRMLVALGSADVSIWELCDGTVAITPA